MTVNSIKLNSRIQLQFGGFKHLYTADAGCLYSGMLLVSTNLTSPGANESSLCLKFKKEDILSNQRRDTKRPILL